MWWRRFALLTLVVVLVGCSRGGIDPQQLRICRLALPALHAESARTTIIREAAGPEPASVAIDYRLAEPGRGARVVRTVCGFGGSGLHPDRYDLVAVITDGRAWSDIKLHILKRWWLEPLGVAAGAEPAAEQHVRGLDLPDHAAYLLQQTVNGLPSAAVYALLAVAYSLVYGLLNRIVLTFGEIAIFGSYGVLTGVSLAFMAGPVPPFVALPAGLALGLLWSGIIAVVAARVVVAPLGGRTGQAMIIATLGFAIVIQEVLRLTQGAGDRWLPAVGGAAISLATSPDGFVATVTPMQAFIAVTAFLVSCLMVAFMRWSSFGRSWRAVADDPVAARLLGVDSRRVLVVAMVLGGLLAGLAGWILLVHYGGVSFFNGMVIGLKALAAAVLGGALLGGLVIGMAETLWSGYFSSAWRDVAILGGLIMVLAVRPGGFFGFAELGPRRV